MTEIQNHWLSAQSSCFIERHSNSSCSFVFRLSYRSIAPSECFSQGVSWSPIYNNSLYFCNKSLYVILAFWLVTYDLLARRCKDSQHSWQDWWMSDFWSCSCYVNLMFVEPQRSTWLLAKLFPRSFVYHSFVLATSWCHLWSVICYWIDTWQHGM